MAKSENQRLKLLYIRDMLLQKTDQNHYLTTNDIIKELNSLGVSAERKSIYSDIQLLNEKVIEIENNKTKPQGYYVEERDFELAEVKLLVDLVEASKFVTEKKSRQLIKKLEQLTNIYNANTLQRNIIVSDRIKAENESIYYNVDYIHEAISKNHKISFQYFQWTVEKTEKMKHNGEIYTINPWRLNWAEENYYLIGYDDEEGKVKYFRVDKMRKVQVLLEERVGCEHLDCFDFTNLYKRTFGMFAGEEEVVTMVMEESLAGVVIDRFGKNVMMRRLSDGFFETRVKVAVSKPFFGWLTGLGKQAKITAPSSVRERYRDYLMEIVRNYL